MDPRWWLSSSKPPLITFKTLPKLEPPLLGEFPRQTTLFSRFTKGMPPNPLCSRVQGRLFIGKVKAVYSPPLCRAKYGKRRAVRRNPILYCLPVCTMKRNTSPRLWYSTETLQIRKPPKTFQSHFQPLKCIRQWPSTSYVSGFMSPIYGIYTFKLTLAILLYTSSLGNGLFE